MKFAPTSQGSFAYQSLARSALHRPVASSLACATSATGTTSSQAHTAVKKKEHVFLVVIPEEPALSEGRMGNLLFIFQSHLNQPELPIYRSRPLHCNEIE
jgi:hypothetical protein